MLMLPMPILEQTASGREGEWLYVCMYASFHISFHINELKNLRAKFELCHI